MATASTGGVSSSGAARHPLDAAISPRSVAVVGVTPTPGTVPYDIFYNILAGGYRGTLYPVAPGKRNICSVRAYRYVIDIDDQVDLAVIVFPYEVVDRALEQCGKKGIPAAIVISAGFREVGPEGVAREQRIKDICRKYNISLIGPNCLGLINTDPSVQLNASFARKMPAAGRIAFLSQSGALCTAVLDYARQHDIGFSKFISFGNKAGVTEIDLLEYLCDDPQTDVILLYLEELQNGRALMEVARRITRGPNAKPILAIKSGRTPQGADAAASHTGSLAGEDAICDAVFQESGIVRVGSIDALFNTATLYDYQPMPQGNRLAIVTNAGGPGVMATDAAVHYGLSIARFDPNTTTSLRAALPATANVKNPVDVIGDARADRYLAALEAVQADANVDQVLVILTPQSMTDIESIARGICQVAKGATKPITCSFMGAVDVADGIRLLQESRIPHYMLPEWCCRAMSDVQRIRQWRQQPIEEPQALPVDAPAAHAVLDAAPPGFLTEDQGLAVLAAYGLPVPAHRLCFNADEAVEWASQIGYPVVLRLVSPQVVHKSEVRAVALNVANSDALLGRYDQMIHNVTKAVPDADIRGMLVRRMIPSGHEVILGAKRDPGFGPTLMFGMGGIYVEYFQDVTFALAPLDRFTASRMVRQIRAYPLLNGARGGHRADVDAIAQCLIRLGQLVHDFPRILELDVNPLIAGSSGSVVADVRIRLGP